MATRSSSRAGISRRLRTAATQDDVGDKENCPPPLKERGQEARSTQSSRAPSKGKSVLLIQLTLCDYCKPGLTTSKAPSKPSHSFTRLRVIEEDETTDESEKNEELPDEDLEEEEGDEAEYKGDEDEEEDEDDFEPEIERHQRSARRQKPDYARMNAAEPPESPSRQRQPRRNKGKGRV